MQSNSKLNYLRFIGFWFGMALLVAGMASGAWFLWPVALTLYVAIPVAISLFAGIGALSAWLFLKRSSAIQPIKTPDTETPPIRSVVDNPSVQDSSLTGLANELTNLCEDRINFMPFYDKDDPGLIPFTLPTGYSYLEPIDLLRPIKLNVKPGQAPNPYDDSYRPDLNEVTKKVYRCAEDIEMHFYCQNHRDQAFFANDNLSLVQKLQLIAAEIDNLSPQQRACTQYKMNKPFSLLTDEQKHLIPNHILQDNEQSENEQLDHIDYYQVELTPMQSAILDLGDTYNPFDDLDESQKGKLESYLNPSLMSEKMRTNHFLHQLTALILQADSSQDPNHTQMDVHRIPFGAIHQLLKCPRTGKEINNPVLLQDGTTVDESAAFEYEDPYRDIHSKIIINNLREIERQMAVSQNNQTSDNEATLLLNNEKDLSPKTSSNPHVLFKSNEFKLSLTNQFELNITTRQSNEEISSSLSSSSSGINEDDYNSDDSVFSSESDNEIHSPEI